MADIVKVIFRKEDDGTILAVFPEFKYLGGSVLDCYAHIGQHGSCTHDYCTSATTLAKPDEYKDLLNEIRQIYAPAELKILRRFPNVTA